METQSSELVSNLLYLGIIGMLIMLIMSVWYSLVLLVVAFRQSIWWGLGYLLVPFVPLVFLFVHWDEAKSPFLKSILTLFILLVGVTVGDHYNLFVD